MMMTEAAEAAGRSILLSAIPITIIIVSIAPHLIVKRQWSIVGCRHCGQPALIRKEAAVLVRDSAAVAAAPPPIPLSDSFVSIVFRLEKK
jgi:hypothetical protein